MQKYQNQLIILGVILVVCFFIFGFDQRRPILGKILVLGVLVYLASLNLTWGLLGALGIIAYFKAVGSLEGMENAAAPKPPAGVSVTSAPPAADKKKTNRGTIDLETVKAAIQPKQSNTMPTPPAQSTENVLPSAGKESFKLMGAPY